MKKLLVVFCMAALLAACGESSKSRTSESDAENTEENSGEVATPLEDSTTMSVDTVSTPTESDSIR